VQTRKTHVITQLMVCFFIPLIVISIQVFEAGGLLQRRAFRRKDYIRREKLLHLLHLLVSVSLIGHSLAMLDVLETASVYVFYLTPFQRFHARLTDALRL
jgi:hypothetical protein